MFTLLVSILILSLSFVSGTEYFVDGTSGDDNNPGTNLESAFRTIQKCVDTLNFPGDSCNVRAGRYHEQVHVEGLRGTAESPILIKGWKDEQPVWDGTIKIEVESWEFSEDKGICSTKIAEDIFALFLDEKLLTAAR